MQLQITGQITGIEARNGGWFAVAIQEQGQNYPKKLSSKKPEIVQQAQSLMGQYVTALYNESESTNINPNNGMPYMNRFLEALSMPGQVLPQAPQQSFQPQPQPQAQNFQAPQPQFQGQPQTFAGQQPAVPFTPQQQPIPQGQITHVVGVDQIREAKIHRQSAAKVAVELLVHLDPADRNLASLVRISEQLVQYFDNGVQWTTPPVQQPVQNTAQAPQQFGPAPEAFPDAASTAAQQQSYEAPDDGIPF